MNKIGVLLLIFLSFSCEEKKIREQVPTPVNFEMHRFEEMPGTYERTFLTSYIDKSNGNLVYIASTYDGVSLFVVENHSK